VAVQDQDCGRAGGNAARNGVPPEQEAAPAGGGLRLPPLSHVPSKQNGQGWGGGGAFVGHLLGGGCEQIV